MSMRSGRACIRTRRIRWPWRLKSMLASRRASAMTKSYYPVFADLAGRRCVVIGGGLIAQRKVTTLLSYGADVTVISPAVTSRLSRYANARKIRLVARRFRSGDLRNAWLVYAATDDAGINQAVYRESRRNRVFANVVDQTPLCTFIAPAIVRRSGVT